MVFLFVIYDLYSFYEQPNIRNEQCSGYKVVVELNGVQE